LRHKRGRWHWAKKTAALRREAEELKVVRGDQAGGDGPRLRTRLGEIDLRHGECDGILPGAPRFMQKLVIVIVHGVTAVPENRRIDKTKLARDGDMRPWIVKNGISPGGYGGERADAERQREHCGDCKARRTTQLAKGKLQVL
jgi:hypothetical protein